MSNNIINYNLTPYCYEKSEISAWSDLLPRRLNSASVDFIPNRSPLIDPSRFPVQNSINKSRWRNCFEAGQSIDALIRGSVNQARFERQAIEANPMLTEAHEKNRRDVVNWSVARGTFKQQGANRPRSVVVAGVKNAIYNFDNFPIYILFNIS